MPPKGFQSAGAVADANFLAVFGSAALIADRHFHQTNLAFPNEFGEFSRHFGAELKAIFCQIDAFQNLPFE